MVHRLTASSASPSKTIFWPCCIPFSTCTSSTFFSWETLFPLHWLHLSFSLMTSPALRICYKTRQLAVKKQKRPININISVSHLTLCSHCKHVASVGSCLAQCVELRSSSPNLGIRNISLMHHSLSLCWNDETKIKGEKDWHYDSQNHFIINAKKIE